MRRMSIEEGLRYRKKTIRNGKRVCTEKCRHVFFNRIIYWDRTAIRRSSGQHDSTAGPTAETESGNAAFIDAVSGWSETDSDADIGGSRSGTAKSGTGGFGGRYSSDGTNGTRNYAEPRRRCAGGANQSGDEKQVRNREVDGRYGGI